MAAAKKKTEENARLTAAELIEFKALLEAKKAKILAQAKATAQKPDAQDMKLSDEVDLASAEYDAAFEYRLRDREEFLISKIDKAIERIAAGTYDECDNCGNPIGKKRLLARPEAVYCFDCKEEQEKVEKMFEKKRAYNMNTFEF